MMKNNVKPLCLVCMQVIDVMKEYNVKRYYETQHKMHYEEYYGKTGIDIADCLNGNIRNKRKF